MEGKPILYSNPVSIKLGWWKFRRKSFKFTAIVLQLKPLIIFALSLSLSILLTIYLALQHTHTLTHQIVCNKDDLTDQIKIPRKE